MELSFTVAYLRYMATKNTRIDEHVLDRVNDHVKMSGQPASVFIGIGVTLLLDTVQGQKASKTKYFSEMGEYLMKEINKKKK